MNFFINEDEFKPNLTMFSARILFFDITDFLKKGDNTIDIKPLSNKDLEKTISAWIEVVE